MTPAITRDVIQDLLPLYAAGEVSADTKRLVEAHLAQDPDLARLARTLSQSDDIPPSPPTAAPTREPWLVGVERTKDLLRQRTGFLAGAIACTLMPFAFAFDMNPTRITFFMLRDAPVVAASLLSSALVFWVGFAWTARRLRVAGL